MRECDNSKIHKSRNFLFSICLIILDNLLLVLKNISCAMVGVPDAARCIILPVKLRNCHYINHSRQVQLFNNTYLENLKTATGGEFIINPVRPIMLTFSKLLQLLYIDM